MDTEKLEEIVRDQAKQIRLLTIKLANANLHLEIAKKMAYEADLTAKLYEARWRETKDRLAAATDAHRRDIAASVAKDILNDPEMQAAFDAQEAENETQK